MDEDAAKHEPPAGSWADALQGRWGPFVAWISLAVPALLFFVGWMYQSARRSGLGLPDPVPSPPHAMVEGASLLLWFGVVLAALWFIRGWIANRMKWKFLAQVEARHPLVTVGALVTVATMLTAVGGMIRLGQSRRLDIPGTGIAWTDLAFVVAGLAGAATVFMGVHNHFKNSTSTAANVGFAASIALMNVVALGAYGGYMGADEANDLVWRCNEVPGVEVTSSWLGFTNETFVFLGREDGMLYVRDPELRGSELHVSFIPDASLDFAALTRLPAINDC